MMPGWVQGLGRRVLDTRRPRLLLTLFCLLLWTPGFFTLPPGDRDESRFVQASKQMIETGDFIRIRNGAEARNRKPIGIHWLQVPFAAAARGLGLATGNPVWPYRIPSALGGLCAVLATFWAGQALVGRRAALLAAGMLAACVVLVVEVHIAKTDAALLGATTVGMAVLARAYLDPAGLRPGGAALFWLAMGAGVLLKGPVTPMVAGLAVLALVAADRRGAPWRGAGAHGADGSDAGKGDADRGDVAGGDVAGGHAGGDGLSQKPGSLIHEAPTVAGDVAAQQPGGSEYLAGRPPVATPQVQPAMTGQQTGSSASAGHDAGGREAGGSGAGGRAGWLWALRPSWGVPLMLAAVLPWFVAIGVATDGRFFADAVGGDLGRKLSSGDDAHWGPPGLHLLLLPVLLFPLSGLLPGAALAAWRGRRMLPVRFLLAWVVPSWIVFEAVPTKLPHYTLPLYPALCLLAAWWLLDPGRAALPRWGRRLAVALPAVGAAVLGAGGLALPVALGMPGWLGGPAVLAAGLAGWLAVRSVSGMDRAALLPLPSGEGRGEGSPAARSPNHRRTSPAPSRVSAGGLPHPNPLPEGEGAGWGEGVLAAGRGAAGADGPRLPAGEGGASRPSHPNPLPGGEGAVAALAASVVLYAAILGFELPRLAPVWIAPRVVAALPERGGLGAVGFAEPSLMFLAGTDTQWLLAADGPAALASRRIRILLTGDRDRAAVLAAAERERVRLQEVAAVPGFNVSRGRWVALTLYRLAP